MISCVWAALVSVGCQEREASPLEARPPTLFQPRPQSEPTLFLRFLRMGLSQGPARTTGYVWVRGLRPSVSSQDWRTPRFLTDRGSLPSSAIFQMGKLMPRARQSVGREPGLEGRSLHCPEASPGVRHMPGIPPLEPPPPRETPDCQTPLSAPGFCEPDPRCSAGQID